MNRQGWLMLVAVLGILSGGARAAGLSFDEANRLSRGQVAQISASYEEKWDAVNGFNHLDERDGCYEKSPGALQQVLVIDAKGVVTDVIADQDNDKARCFRNSYLNFQFPPPPFVPYYLYLKMQ